MLGLDIYGPCQVWVGYRLVFPKLDQGLPSPWTGTPKDGMYVMFRIVPYPTLHRFALQIQALKRDDSKVSNQSIQRCKKRTGCLPRNPGDRWMNTKLSKPILIVWPTASLDDSVPIKTPPTQCRSGTHREMDNLGRSIGVAHLYGSGQRASRAHVCPCGNRTPKKCWFDKSSPRLSVRSHTHYLLFSKFPSACTIRQLSPIVGGTHIWIVSAVGCLDEDGPHTPCKATVDSAGWRVNEISQWCPAPSMISTCNYPKFHLVWIPPLTHSHHANDLIPGESCLDESGLIVVGAKGGGGKRNNSFSFLRLRNCRPLIRPNTLGWNRGSGSPY